MAKISVLIPVYNTGNYLLRLLKSIEKQTFRDFDVVLVNDGSTDNSLEIINGFIAESNLDIRCINQPNLGAAAARINALKVTSSPYIVFLDSDDYIEQNYLEVLLKTIEDTGANICVSRISFHPNNVPFLSIKNKNIRGTYDLFEDKYILPIMQCGFVAKIYRRDNIILPDKSFNGNEDLSINHLSYAIARHVSFTNDTCYHYLPNNNGLSARLTVGYDYEKILKTLIPLTSLKNSFIEYNMFDRFYLELESLFIRFIFQRITDIMFKEKNRDISYKLISLLLSYLGLHFPNWKNNKYYLNNFSGFEIPDKLYCMGANIYFSTHSVSPEEMSEEEILKEYRKIYN